MHVVPGVDDGAADINMSLEMLRMAYDQGIRCIFCTSHNGYSMNDQLNYLKSFELLKARAQTFFPDMKLLPGCELLCEMDNIEDILNGLSHGIYLSLNNTQYVLTEFYTDTDRDEVTFVTKALLSAGWIPIIAHAERYPNLSHDNTIEELIKVGCKIQINLFSLQNERNPLIQTQARYLLKKQLVHFVGSDAHRITHRPPIIHDGIEYILTHSSTEYAAQILKKNARKIM